MKHNISCEICRWPNHYTPIPKPFCVVKVDDHWMVCTVDKDDNLIEEVSAIHWDKLTVRRWAFHFALEKEQGNE